MVRYLMVIGSLALLSSCGMQLYCPAYQSAFILDDDKQQDTYALFTVFEGDTVPKRPYGFKYQAKESDSLFQKFLEGTDGKGFRVQRGRPHAQVKYGFSYDNRVKDKLWVRVFRPKEKFYVTNPFFFSKANPYKKMNHLEMKITHFNTSAYDSLVKETIIAAKDSVFYDSLITHYVSLPPAIQAQYVPLLRRGYNNEQAVYNKQFGDYFLVLEEPKPMDSTALKSASLAGENVELDSIGAEKKGIFGIFKKKKTKQQEEKKGDDGNQPMGILPRDDE